MFGKRIRKLRDMLKLTQIEFANKLGISSRTVYQWEHDQVKIKESSLRLIENTFDVNPDWLRHDKGKVFLPKAEADITPDLDDVFAWQKSLPRDKQVWLKVEMARLFPEFKEWLEK